MISFILPVESRAIILIKVNYSTNNSCVLISLISFNSLTDHNSWAMQALYRWNSIFVIAFFHGNTFSRYEIVYWATFILTLIVKSLYLLRYLHISNSLYWNKFKTRTALKRKILSCHTFQLNMTQDFLSFYDETRNNGLVLLPNYFKLECLS